MSRRFLLRPYLAMQQGTVYLLIDRQLIYLIRLSYFLNMKNIHPELLYVEYEIQHFCLEVKYEQRTQLSL